MLAVRADTLAALGAHVTPHGRLIPTKSYAAGITGLYAIPAAHLRVRAMFTNTVPTEAYRGAGRPEALYVIERLADLAAKKLGLSREEIRRRNFIAPAAMPHTTPTAEIFDSGEFDRNLTDVLANAEADAVARRKAEARARGRLLGFGLSSYVKINGGSPDEMAEIRFDAGGGVAVIAGTQANGQGHATSFAQLVADRLGVPFESVQMVQGDSDQVPYGNGTGGSSFLAVGGSAVNGAIDKVIESGKRIAGHLLEAAPADLVFAAGRYAIAGTDRGVPMAEVARAAFRAGPWSTETGFGLAERSFYRQRGKTFANGCHVCEVEIDPETGGLEVVRYTIVDDVGRVMNPMLVRGQVHGGLAQGLGQALMERTAYDPDSGQLLAGSLMDYCLPRASDFPHLDISFNEVPCTTNPLGVKGVGEAGTTGSMPALVGAVVDALAEYGVTHLDMPLTPERVWRAIHGGKAA
jgi:carbon-monoxide dehydrogenase large subunit